MPRLKLSGKELRAIGYPEGPVIPIAMNIMEKNFKQKDKSEALQLFNKCLLTHKNILKMKYWERLQNIALAKKCN